MANVPGGRTRDGAERLRHYLARLGRSPFVEHDFVEEQGPPSWAPVDPFHPARAVRSYLESHPQAWAAPGDATRLELRARPHASALDADEARLLDLLALPRAYHELRALTPRADALARLLAFLEHGGLLVRRDDEWRARALGELGLGADADDAAIRRAWKRLARAEHPDMHPGESPEHPRAIERRARFDRLREAYARLTDEPAGDDPDAGGSSR